MTLGSREGNGPWRDVTQERIDEINRSIATYERIATAIKNKEDLMAPEKHPLDEKN
jgi:hypothetical protein